MTVILSPSSEVTHGPQSVQEEVLGRPKIKAIRERTCATAGVRVSFGGRGRQA